MRRRLLQLPRLCARDDALQFLFSYLVYKAADAFEALPARHPGFERTNTSRHLTPPCSQPPERSPMAVW